jgi:hypothetical protein
MFLKEIKSLVSARKPYDILEIHSCDFCFWSRDLARGKQSFTIVCGSFLVIKFFLFVQTILRVKKLSSRPWHRLLKSS